MMRFMFQIALDLQSGNEAPDRPVLFVEATPDTTPTPTPHTAPSTPSTASHSPRPAPTLPTPAAVPNQAPATSGTSGGGLGPLQPPSPQQQGSHQPPPGMPLRDWIKQKKRSAATAGANTAFPSIQVYCPCGSAGPDLNPQPSRPMTPQRVQLGAAQDCSGGHTGNTRLPPASQEQESVDSRYGRRLHTVKAPLADPSNAPLIMPPSLRVTKCI